MGIDYSQFAIPKPEPRKRVKARKKRAKQKQTREVRPYVFARERDICRCCRFRQAESMHERRPKSLRGRVSRENSMAVCGDGVRGCHGFLQRHEIECSITEWGCENTLWFQAMTEAAAEWLRIPRLQTIVSPVMQQIEEAL